MSSLLEINDKIKTGTSFTITFQALPVPEPAALSLVALGSVAVLTRRRQRS